MDKVMVAICTPSGGHTCMDYAVSLGNLALFSATHALKEGIKEQGISISSQQSFSTSCNRETLVELLPGESTHIFFVDDDMGFEEDVLKILMGRGEKFVLGNYQKKQEGEVWVALDDEGRQISSKGKTGLQPCRFGGLGMALIETEIFFRLSQPWFPVPWNTATKHYVSEDYSLFNRVKKELGITPMVDHDVSNKIWHVGNKRYGRME